MPSEPSGIEAAAMSVVSVREYDFDSDVEQLPAVHATPQSDLRRESLVATPGDGGQIAHNDLRSGEPERVSSARWQRCHPIRRGRCDSDVGCAVREC
jgi:hypothetical protein